MSVARHGLGYLLACDAQRVDIHAFRQLIEQARQTGDDEAKAALLRRALGLWRGPVLADVITTRLRQEVFASLEEARLTAVNERIDAELRLGRHLDLVDELTGLLARYPDRQPFVAQLMLALYRCGRVPDASAVFRRTRRRLRQEYGLRFVAGAHQAARRHPSRDPSLPAPVRPGRPRGGGPRPPDSAGMCPDFRWGGRPSWPGSTP